MVTPKHLESLGPGAEGPQVRGQGADNPLTPHGWAPTVSLPASIGGESRMATDG